MEKVISKSREGVSVMVQEHWVTVNQESTEISPKGEIWDYAASRTSFNPKILCFCV